MHEREYEYGPEHAADSASSRRAADPRPRTVAAVHIMPVQHDSKLNYLVLSFSPPAIRPFSCTTAVAALTPFAEAAVRAVSADQRVSACSEYRRMTSAYAGVATVLPLLH